MAFQFNGSTQSLSASGAPVTTYPMSFHALAKKNDTSSLAFVVGIGESEWQNNFIRLRIDPDSDANKAGITVYDSSVHDGFSSSTFTTNWTAISASLQSAESRSIYVNGSGKATFTESKAPIGINAMAIGALLRATPLGFMSGEICEAAIWSAALTDDEIASLAKGFKPTRIRPQRLVFYAPLLRNLQDLKSGLALTNNNGATVADHPRVY